MFICFCLWEKQMREAKDEEKEKMPDGASGWDLEIGGKIKQDPITQE